MTSQGPVQAGSGLWVCNVRVDFLLRLSHPQLHLLPYALHLLLLTTVLHHMATEDLFTELAMNVQISIAHGLLVVSLCLIGKER